MSISRAAEKGRRQLQTSQLTTSLPFLYGTRTIVGSPGQRRYATYAIQPRKREPTAEQNDSISEGAVSQQPQSHKSSPRASHRNRDESQPTRRPRQYSSRSDHIPFESLPNESANPQDELAGSTITPSERRSFEGLFKLQRKKVNSGTEPLQRQLPHNAPDQELEAILSGVEKEIRGQERQERPKPQMPKALRAMMDIGSDGQPLQRSKMEHQLVEQGNAKQQAIAAQITRVRELLEAATVDVEVWNILQENVFQRLKALGLDEQRNDSDDDSSNHGRPPQAPDDSVLPEVEVLSATAPANLEKAIQQLRQRFPGSPLAYAVLPTLRSLGPSAFAVGASTRLFNAHMRLIISTQPANLLGVVEVLEEMDKLVYEFDDWTLDILKEVERKTIVWLSGRRGEGGRAVFRSPAVRVGMRKIRVWISEVERRLQESALRKATMKEEMRELDTSEYFNERRKSSDWEE